MSTVIHLSTSRKQKSARQNEGIDPFPTCLKDASSLSLASSLAFSILEAAELKALPLDDLAFLPLTVTDNEREKGNPQKVIKVVHISSRDSYVGPCYRIPTTDNADISVEEMHVSDPQLFLFFAAPITAFARYAHILEPHEANHTSCTYNSPASD